MRFSREMIEAIVEDRKSQTRRLVKPGEIASFTSKTKNTVAAVYRGNKCVPENLKWRVGLEESVLDESGKAVWWCPKCKEIIEPENSEFALSCMYHPSCGKKFNFKPLRFRITQICQERLLDVTEENAKAEGFKYEREFITARYNFLIAFFEIYKEIVPKEAYEENVNVKGNTQIDFNKWNPLVWAISFKKGDDKNGEKTYTRDF